MASPTVEKMMKAFQANLGSEKFKWLMAQFHGTKTIDAMFKTMWETEDAHQSLNPSLIPSGKSENEAKYYLLEGDRYLKEKCLNKALEQYTLCIMNAPQPPVGSSCSEHEKLISDGTHPRTLNDYTLLATAYAKRSAVLLQLEKIEEGLNDIDLALANGYPDSKGDLEYMKLKYTPSNNNTVLNGEILRDTKSSIQMSVNKNIQKVPKLTDPDPSLPSLSKSVRVAYSKDKGKHIIAERDINPGEIIGVERSITGCLAVVNLPSYCSSCYRSCLAPLPCPECSMVVFCSEACITEAMKGDHWLECSLLPTMVSMGMQPVFSVAFKLLKRFSCAQWRSSIQNQEDLNTGGQIREIGSEEVKDFYSVLHLATNKELRPSGDLYVKCIIAFMQTKLLQQTGRYFINEKEESISPSKEDLLFTGQLLFSYLLKISCNGFTLVEFQCSRKFSEMKKKIIGSGIFPTLCLLNHSCHPNAEPYTYGRFQVLRASRPISAGSEVHEGYCRGFYLQPKAARQTSLLKIFQFECSCEACDAGWPTYPELPNTLQFKCIDCMGPVNDLAPMCMKCFLDYERKDCEPNKQILIDRWWDTVKMVRKAFVNSQTIASKMMSGDAATEEDLSTICEAISLLEKHVTFPCHPLWDAHDALDLYFHQERESGN
ncbi:hypothetical protein SK128_012847 [Halocaridina rubra]|uniref:Protein-lysine N-methyltransferase SMYD4 n=1 Tax=Halocaridina rubra TaxID=373956 RepID=A0AAN9A940_HALRR